VFPGPVDKETLFIMAIDDDLTDLVSMYNTVEDAVPWRPG